MSIVFFATAAENIPEVLVVLVGLRWLLSSHVTLLPGCGVDTQRTRSHVWYSGGAAIAYEITLVEQLDKIVFAMARDGAGVAHGCWVVYLCG